MSDQQHFETAPEDKISLPKKLIYGLGAFVNNILAAAMGGMVVVLNLGLGMNPIILSLNGVEDDLTFFLGRSLRVSSLHCYGNFLEGTAKNSIFGFS